MCVVELNSGALTVTCVCGRADSGVCGVLTVTCVCGRADRGMSMWCTYSDLCVW